MKPTLRCCAIISGRAHTATTETAAAPVEKPKVERKQSIDPQTAQKLEKSLAHRPEKNELIERNILKGMYILGSKRCCGQAVCGAGSDTVATNR